MMILSSSHNGEREKNSCAKLVILRREWSGGGGLKWFIWPTFCWSLLHHYLSLSLHFRSRSRRLFIIIESFRLSCVISLCSYEWDEIQLPRPSVSIFPLHSHSHSIQWKFLPLLSFVYRLINILFPIPQKGVLGVIRENSLALFPSLVCRKLITRWDQTGNGWLYNCCWREDPFSCVVFSFCVCNSLVIP